MPSQIFGKKGLYLCEALQMTVDHSDCLRICISQIVRTKDAINLVVYLQDYKYFLHSTSFGFCPVAMVVKPVFPLETTQQEFGN